MRSFSVGAAVRVAILSCSPWLAARAATLPVPCAGTCGSGATGFVTAGQASAATSGSKLTVTQSSANATLNWKSFNISSDGTVQFVQPSSSAVALNEIYDSNPSQIFGALNANGRVFLINPNGIVFGPTAQVNVGGLVASTLNIAADAAQNGLLHPGQTNGAPAFTAATDANGNPISGVVQIDQGANLQTSEGGQILAFATTSVTNQGTISTPGGQTILAAGDQIYLTSDDSNIRGLVVEVGSGNGTVTNGTSANSGVTSPQQLVGQIVAEDGNVTLAAMAVNQEGRISATTSVNENGSIYLEAGNGGSVQSNPSSTYGNSQPDSVGGTLTLGQNSDTEVTLDSSSATVADSVPQPKSDVRMTGKTVDVLDGSTVRATSGNIQITALSNLQDASNLTDQSDGSSFYVAPGAVLDVSGASETLPVSSNVVSAELRATELADSFEQRNGPLYAQTVQFDDRLYGMSADGTPWYGTPLADVSGEIGALQHNVTERNLTGGTITVESQGDVILAPSSMLDLAGGAIDYTGGYMDTTELRTASGQLVNIGSASPEVPYSGIANNAVVSDAKWGTSSTYGVTQSTYQPGYIQGYNAGTLNLTAPAFVFDASVDGKATAGLYQTVPAGEIDSTIIANEPDPVLGLYNEAPQGATLNIGGGSSAGFLVVNNVTIASGQVLPALRNADGTPFNPLTDPLPASYTASILSPDLFGPDGFSYVRIETDGSYEQPAGEPLQLPAGGSFSVTASTIDVQSSIDIPAGSISLAAENTVPDVSESVSLSLGPTVSLIASGEWVNDNPVLYPQGNPAPLYIDGGTVSLAARIQTGTTSFPLASPDLDLAPGSLIDVSGGAQLTSTGAVNAGSGGSIDIASESGPLVGPAPQLTLGSTLRGYALYQGGTLSLTAASVCIAAGDCSGGDPTVLWLAPQFLQSGGFGAYFATAKDGALTVAPGTIVTLAQQNLQLPGDYASLSDATSLNGIATTTLLPQWAREPVDLTLALDQVATTDGGFSSSTPVLEPVTAPLPVLTIGEAAVISSAPGAAAGAEVGAQFGGATLTASSNTSLIDEGTLEAPGGDIALNLLADVSQSQYVASQAIWLASGAVLDAAGTPVTYLNGNGQRVGQVLGGGSVSLTANRGYIELLPGSDIDVAGSSALIDEIPPGGGIAKAEQVASAGGSIALTAAEGLTLGGAFQAAAGTAGPGVTQPAGGSLSVALDPSNRNDIDDVGNEGTQTFPTVPDQVIVTQTLAPIVIAPGTVVPNSLAGEAFIPAAMLEASGFDMISLQSARYVAESFGQSATQDATLYPGTIEFQGNVNLTAPEEVSLDAEEYYVSPGATAQISAPYVEFGSTDLFGDLYSEQPTSSELQGPTSGTGTLAVSGGFIELYGTSALQDIGLASFDSTGDLRLRGLQDTDEAPPAATITGGLYAGGTIDLDAEQIYPSTLTQFTISTDPSSGIIQVTGSPGANADLLSAGGTLILSAGTVVQDGVLRAPFGTIAIDAQNITLGTGSITSTSANGLTIPFGTTQGDGQDWVYPLEDSLSIIYGTDGIAPPSQLVSLNGTNITVQKGAQINVSGGGDLQAYEFINGPEGTNDILDDATTEFAVLPGLKANVAPFDPAQSASSSLQIGDAIYLAAGSGLPAGTYTLLPATYALLPGAYLVKEVPGYSDIQPGQTYAAADEGTIVAGYWTVSGLNVGSSITSGFDVLPASLALQGPAAEAQYDLTSADSFFSSQASAAGVAAPRLPQDGGVLQLAASGQLALEQGYELQSAPAVGGLGGEVDISSADIEVSSSADAGSQSGVLVLAAPSLDELGVQTLLLGGDDSNGTITTTANDITIDAGADLTLPQLLLTAQNQITVNGSLTASGTGPSGGAYTLAGTPSGGGTTNSGAFLSVSAGGQVSLTSSGAGGSGGVLTLAPGSTLSANGGSIYMYGTQDVSIATGSNPANIAITGGDLAVQAPEIALGNVSTAPSGATVLDQNVLAAAGLQNLLLISNSTVDVISGASASAQNITLEAEGLNGYDASAGDTATLTAAGTLTLANPQGGLAATSGNGESSLALDAANIVFAGGTLTASGFGSVSLNAASTVTAQNSPSASSQGKQNAATPTVGGLTVSGGNLVVTASRITVGSDDSLNLWATSVSSGSGVVGGAVSLLAPGSPASLPAATGLGGSLTVEGSTVELATQIDLPAGAVTFETTGGDLALDPTAAIDVAGVVESYNGVTVASPGGSVALSSTANVNLASGSSVDVSAGSGGNGGSLSILAPNGTMTVGSNVALNGSGTGASFSIVAQGYDFPALAADVNAGGFSGSQSYRLLGTTGSGGSANAANDLALASGQTLTAQNVSLEADQGGIDVGGTIDASGSNGGTVTLAAANSITLTGAIDAQATAAGGNGGSVSFELGSAGTPTLDLAGGPNMIDVAGDGGAGGTVLLRLPQQSFVAGGNDGITVDGTIEGAASTTLEAVNTIIESSGVITSADETAAENNASTFMTQYQTAIAAALGPILPSFVVVPGEEIDAVGDLALDDDWDLSSASTPAILTLRATGDITFNASLSDGFDGTTGTNAFTLPTTAIDSWSYRITAGASETQSGGAAIFGPNPLSVDAQPLETWVPAGASVSSGANVEIAACQGSCTPYESGYDPVMVRTGNGFVDVAASGNFELDSQASMLYTAGVAAPGITLNGLASASSGGGRKGSSGTGSGLAYPTDGGDISIDVDGNVIGAPSNEFVNAWLWRTGGTTPTASATAWSVDFQSFQQGVGALAGGNVTVAAGGSIQDLSVSIPSIGVQVGGATQAQNQVAVEGGGTLEVSAGGSILGGSYYVGLGGATLTAGSDIGNSVNTGYSPIVGLGDASVSITARGSAELAGILNPTLLNTGTYETQNAASENFSTYGTNSSLNLMSVSGNVTLGSETLSSDPIRQTFTNESIDANDGDVPSTDIMPPTLNLYALGGDINIDGTLVLSPAAYGNLQVLANQNVNLGSTTNAGQLIVSGTDPSLLPTAENPGNDESIYADMVKALTVSESDLYATMPVHEAEDESGMSPVEIVALKGDVSSPPGTSSVSGIWSSKPVDIVAGQNIVNLDLDALNLSASDVTSITAGDSITYPFARTPQGGLLADTLDGITVDGPGELQVSAGDTVNLGTSNGIVTRGDLDDPNLAAEGASISVQAGVGAGEAPYAAFIGQYIDGSSMFDSQLVSYVEQVMGQSNLSPSEAKQAFDAMNGQLQLTFIDQVFLALLDTYGREAADTGNNADYAGAYAAIEKLFPGANPNLAAGQTNPYSGDIDLYFSQIYTEAGGNVSLLAPGGSIEVGLPTATAGFSGLTKSPDQLGVVAETTGNVSAFSYGDFDVNFSRVFAADGGNILVWSTEGNIDAGRGAKTAVSAPLPNIVYDDNGQPTVTFRASLGGSGIQALAASPGVGPGNVDLFAPHGVVNASDAGISGGNITIGATAVLGANNITATGTEVGVPVVATGLGANVVGASSSAAGAVASSSTTVAQNQQSEPNTPEADNALSWLDVFVLGFGEKTCAADDTACLKAEQSAH